jgi:hypothetical protein
MMTQRPTKSPAAWADEAEQEGEGHPAKRDEAEYPDDREHA